jgi:non-heme chloroperoxidase
MGYAFASDGTEIFYNDQGTGRPVILTHGWPLNGDSWDNQTNF